MKRGWKLERNWISDRERPCRSDIAHILFICTSAKNVRVSEVRDNDDVRVFYLEFKQKTQRNVTTCSLTLCYEAMK